MYRGFKVMPFSTACSTPLSNFEAGLNYKDVDDPAVMVRLCPAVSYYLFLSLCGKWPLVSFDVCTSSFKAVHDPAVMWKLWHAPACVCVERGALQDRVGSSHSIVYTLTHCRAIHIQPAVPTCKCVCIVLCFQVSFPIVDASGSAAGDALSGSSLVAWTTTPWTLPSNLALCVHPEFDYVQVLGVCVWRGDVWCFLVKGVVQERAFHGL